MRTFNKKLFHDLFTSVHCTKSYLSGEKKPMKYDVGRTIILASKLQKVVIFLDIFQANNIAPKCSSKMMCVS